MVKYLSDSLSSFSQMPSSKLFHVVGRMNTCRSLEKSFWSWQNQTLIRVLQIGSVYLAEHNNSKGTVMVIPKQDGSHDRTFVSSLILFTLLTPPTPVRNLQSLHILLLPTPFFLFTTAPHTQSPGGGVGPIAGSESFPLIT